MAIGDKSVNAVTNGSESVTVRPNDERYDELVLARAIPFRTVCEHHLLPFAGVAHVGSTTEPADRVHEIADREDALGLLLGHARAEGGADHGVSGRVPRRRRIRAVE